MLKALLTDIDGTITDGSRRIHTGAIDTIRSLDDQGVDVVLASGNTACFMDAVCKMVGTGGTFIAENGGVFRVGFTGRLNIEGDQKLCHKALKKLQSLYRQKGIELELYSPTYRFADLAFARTVKAEEVKAIIKDFPIQVIDTGYAIHLQSQDVNKGTALESVAKQMGFVPSDFLAIGDSLNDIPMLKTAGIGVVVANGHPDAKASAHYVTKKEYGEGFIEAVKKYLPYFRAA